jgi:hypothetical protein
LGKAVMAFYGPSYSVTFLRASARVGTRLVHRLARALDASVHREIATVTPYVQHVQFRKFSPVDREYPIFELVEGDDVMLDVSSSDDGVLEVALHEASIGKVFKLDDLHVILTQGKRLLEEEMAYGA